MITNNVEIDLNKNTNEYILNIKFGEILDNIEFIKFISKDDENHIYDLYNHIKNNIIKRYNWYLIGTSDMLSLWVNIENNDVTITIESIESIDIKLPLIDELSYEIVNKIIDLVNGNLNKLIEFFKTEDI